MTATVQEPAPEEKPCYREEGYDDFRRIAKLIDNGGGCSLRLYLTELHLKAKRGAASLQERAFMEDVKAAHRKRWITYRDALRDCRPTGDVSSYLEKLVVADETFSKEVSVSAEKNDSPTLRAADDLSDLDFYTSDQFRVPMAPIGLSVRVPPFSERPDDEKASSLYDHLKFYFGAAPSEPVWQKVLELLQADRKPPVEEPSA